MQNLRHAARRALPTLAAALSLGACAGGPAVPTESAGEQITRLIGDAACSRETDCATIGIGAMACGGPQAYVAWSSKRTDLQTLTQAVARHREERQRQIELANEKSVCMLVPDPGARCRVVVPGTAGRCELRAPASGGGSPAVR